MDARNGSECLPIEMIPNNFVSLYNIDFTSGLRIYAVRSGNCEESLKTSSENLDELLINTLPYFPVNSVENCFPTNFAPGSIDWG